MKKVLVTGCNGQLGRAIQKECAGQVEFILTDVAEGKNITSLDITDIDAVMTLALDKKPDVIINCAALTNVDGCEKMWDLAYKINAIGPRNLAIAATTMSLPEQSVRHVQSLMSRIRSVPMARPS